MTEERLALSELLEKAGDGDFLRSVAEAVLQLLMETDVDGLIGAGRYERSGERTTWRNGHRDQVLDTRLGSLQLRIPKLRQGSYFPPFLEARKVSEKALIGVSMLAAALLQAFIQPDRAQASQTLRHVADQLRQKWPKLGAFIDDSETDVLSYLDFPEQHRTKHG